MTSKYVLLRIICEERAPNRGLVMSNRRHKGQELPILVPERVSCRTRGRVMASQATAERRSDKDDYVSNSLTGSGGERRERKGVEGRPRAGIQAQVGIQEVAARIAERAAQAGAAGHGVSHRLGCAACAGGQHNRRRREAVEQVGFAPLGPPLLRQCVVGRAVRLQRQARVGPVNHRQAGRRPLRRWWRRRDATAAPSRRRAVAHVRRPMRHGACADRNTSTDAYIKPVCTCTTALL